MDHDAVIHIIYIISLTAVEDLDILLGARHLGLACRLHGVGEGLGDAVVRDGDGPMAPGGGLLHRGGGIRQGIHVAHGGMQVQLHPLFPLRQVLPLGHGAGHHGIGLEDHVVFEPVLDELALDPEHGADFHIFNNGRGFLCFQEPADPDGAGVVRHVEFHHKCVALGQLLVVNGEDLALHDDGAHIHGHFLHGNAAAPEGLPVEGSALLLGRFGGGGLLLCLHRRVGFHGTLAHGGDGVKKRLAFQILSRLHGDGHRGGEPLPQIFLDLGNQLLNGGLAIRSETNGELVPLPVPFGPGQGPPGHGIAADKEHHQLLRLDFM